MKHIECPILRYFDKFEPSLRTLPFTKERRKHFSFHVVPFDDPKRSFEQPKVAIS